MTGDKVLDLVHLFLGEVAVYLHLRVFVTKHLLDLHRVDELKNFAANNLFRLVIEVTYWDPRNWLVTYLGAVHQKGELSLQNKSDWVLG